MNRRDWLRTSGALSAGLLLAGNPMKHLLQPLPLSRNDFGPNFEWGVATAAYQIEGAWDEDGKGPSVWDTFVRKKGKIRNGDHGDVACDHYHRWEQDLDLLVKMGIPNYRFSLAWTRLFPQGRGSRNQQGFDHYQRLIDGCLERGITPWVTLYHWDAPQALEDRGGWTHRDMVGWFTDYADAATRAFGDKVKHWMVLNEPMAFVGVGYMLGLHAPGRKGIGNFLPAAHHAALAQAEGGRVVRANVSGADVGTTFSAAWMMPWKDKEKDARAAARADALFNRFFLEPALGLGYPTDTLPFMQRIEKHFLPGDEERLKFDFDFIGLQNYTREMIRHALWPPVMWGKIVPPAKRESGNPMTEMKWEVYPEGIYHLLKKFAAYPQVKRILVTENGAAFPDKVEDGQVKDTQRVAFLEQYLAQVLRAKQEGVPVEGYFIWTLLDNFEWAEGFFPRFGLVHVDFDTQERIIKDSGWWYKLFLTGQ
jgi:beta-glucosidase